MAAGYIGISGKAKKIKNLYLGVGGVAKKVKKAYIGVGGVAKLWYKSEAEITKLDNLTAKGSGSIVSANIVGNYEIIAVRNVRYLTTVNSSLTVGQLDIYQVVSSSQNTGGSAGNLPSYAVISAGSKMAFYNSSLSGTGTTLNNSIAYTYGAAGAGNYYLGPGSWMWDNSLTKSQAPSPSTFTNADYGSYKGISFNDNAVFGGGEEDADSDDAYTTNKAFKYDSSLTGTQLTNLGIRARSIIGAASSQYCIFVGGYDYTSSGNAYTTAYNTSWTRTLPPVVRTGQLYSYCVGTNKLVMIAGTGQYGSPNTTVVYYDESLSLKTAPNLSLKRYWSNIKWGQKNFLANKYALFPSGDSGDYPDPGHEYTTRIDVYQIDE